ncbi:serine hydrolase [uncultured Nonlabens sp.]|uniref:serine hydrolase n=1 Tax=uncultured Nonlabens sp. TaxID=859306 RepID=UPI0026341C31|nr:serine hydrolase [uncultured Nonlabens sp.]
MKNITKIIAVLFTGVFLLAFYPIDGFSKTGIKRLKRLEKTLDSTLNEYYLRKGSFKKYDEINLWMCEKTDSIDKIMSVDTEFQKEMLRLFPSRSGYGITVLDITDVNNTRYAEMNENTGFQPGSVGKIAVATAFFTELKNLCPEDFNVRTNLMRNKVVKSGNWGLYDHHTIPIYNIEKDSYVKRTVIASDEFTLYEWVDHMLSVSNNGAASIVWREAMLMRVFGDEYFNLTQEQADAYFDQVDKSEITDIAISVVNDPLRNLGITNDEWRLGSLFTNGPDRYVGSKGGSIGTPKGLMKYFIKLEQGLVVDEESSLEIKRLLYMTDRRIRYGASPQLNDAAVYFKSGSFYSNNKSLGTPYGEYKGNVYNYMNSVCIVEHPSGVNYIVCLESNVLSKNSAGAHLYLASAIDKAIRKKYEVEEK